jgi:cyanophycin synthetase
MHLKPADGEPRPVGQAIVDHLFAQQEDGRIPVVGISGSHGKTEVARLLARMLQLHGTYVGMACSDGLFLNDRQIEKGDCANWESARRVLLNRATEVAVFESGPRAILAEGLGYDRCKIGVVTCIDPAANLPQFHIDDADQMVNVIRTQVDVVLPDGVAVLNGGDARVADLARLCDGEVLLFGVSAELPALAEHLAAGGRAVFSHAGQLVLATGSNETRLVSIPFSYHDQRLESLLAAVGAAWALGLPAELIRAGLATSALPAAARNN